MSVRSRLEELIGSSETLPCPIREYAFVNPKNLPFSADVRAACESNQCGRYGKSWTCPPGAGSWETLRDHYQSYAQALVFTTCHELEDCFDVEGMEAGRRSHDAVDETVLQCLANERGTHELAGAGSCSLCPQCTYPDAPCRHPDRARRSMEACGIDVVTLSSQCGLHYMNGADTVTYFSVVFFS